MDLSLPSNRPSNIILIGFMGCGKSSVGMALAHSLKWDFIDTDSMIEARYGNTIAQLFEEKGEGYFRAQERDTARIIANDRRHCVVATGGGFGAMIEDIRQLGWVVYLKLPFEAILARMDKEQKAKRPLFSDTNAAQILYNARAPIYKSQADLIVDATKPVDAIVQAILKKEPL